MSNQKKKGKITGGTVLNIVLVMLIIAIAVSSTIIFNQFSGDSYVDVQEVEMYVMRKEKEVVLEEDRYGNPVEVRHYLVHVQEDEVEDYRYDSGICDSKSMYKSVKEGDKVLMKKHIYKTKKDNKINDVTFEFIKIIED